jgi:two-component system, OmpR family, response regulator
MTAPTPHILIVDDDPDIRRPLGRFLTQHDFRTSLAADGREMDVVLSAARVDLVVLDIMMPGEDGLSICRRLRDRDIAPVILLTARGDDVDRIVGLEIGADDYLPKPFNPRELVARIRSVIRRAEGLPRRTRRASGIARFDRWRFDLASQQVVDEEGQTTALTSGEHALLVAFVERSGVTLTREQLLDLTKGREAQPFDRSIDNQVSRLRRKLEVDSRSPRIVLTRWGGGYLFAADVEWLA